MQTPGHANRPDSGALYPHGLRARLQMAARQAWPEFFAEFRGGRRRRRAGQVGRFHCLKLRQLRSSRGPRVASAIAANARTSLGAYHDQVRRARHPVCAHFWGAIFIPLGTPRRRRAQAPSDRATARVQRAPL